VPGLRLPVALLAVLLALLAYALPAGGADGRAPAAGTGEPAPVASLEPERTAALWSRLVSTPARPAQTPPGQCRPLRAVFYATSDWLRLATKLATSASPCADYYISIPPVVADKTQPRRDQAWRIRALGPRFHALAEIHFATWSRWVASTGTSWRAAGVTARERMAAAGYDVASGDTWALNELTSGVRRGEGTARANLREFLRGLYDGDGRTTRGAVFVIGVGQGTPDVSVYQGTLQSWLTDTAFWTDMATYVSDWSQEVYGDVRRWAIPGFPLETRRELLNDYLQHKLVLAGAGPAEIEAARTHLRETYSPLANAAWQRDAAYGWTMAPVETMAGYISAQVDALRRFSAANGQARDHWGFAWATRNTAGMPGPEFAAQTSALLDRLAAAIRDSGQVVAEDPGGGACGPAGQNTWCVGDVEGAAPNEAWKSFRAWTQPVLAFATPPQSLVAGTPSAPIGLSLVTATGLPAVARTPLPITFSSSSPGGLFATTTSGPWTPTLGVTMAAGVGAVTGVYYLDTLAGSHVLTASAPGATSATQPVTVSPGPLARVAVTPESTTVRARGTRSLSGTATDAFANPVPATLAWRVTPSALGRIGATTTRRATFTAERLLGSGSVLVLATGADGAASGAASLTVTPARLRIASIRSRRTSSGVRLELTAVDGARRPVSKALVHVVVTADGRRSSLRGVTGAAGRALFGVPLRRGACLTSKVVRASAVGFTWDGRAPSKRVCR